MPRKPKTIKETVGEKTRTSSELSEYCWAAVASAGCLGCNLTYDQARQRAEQSGESATIVTDLAASRICTKSHSSSASAK